MLPEEAFSPLFKRTGNSAFRAERTIAFSPCSFWTEKTTNDLFVRPKEAARKAAYTPPVRPGLGTAFGRVVITPPPIAFTTALHIRKGAYNKSPRLHSKGKGTLLLSFFTRSRGLGWIRSLHQDARSKCDNFASQASGHFDLTNSVYDLKEQGVRGYMCYLPNKNIHTTR